MFNSKHSLFTMCSLLLVSKGLCTVLIWNGVHRWNWVMLILSPFCCEWAQCFSKICWLFCRSVLQPSSGYPERNVPSLASVETQKKTRELSLETLNVIESNVDVSVWSKLNLKKMYTLRLKGGAGRKTVLLIFQPTHFIVHLLWSVWKIWRKEEKIPALHFHGNGSHLWF